MPFLRGAPVPLHPHPHPDLLKPVSVSTPLFQITYTGEVFTSYEEYLERSEFYRQRIFTCAATGADKLTFVEALTSESRMLRAIQENATVWNIKTVLSTVSGLVCSRSAAVSAALAALRAEPWKGEGVSFPAPYTAPDGTAVAADATGSVIDEAVSEDITAPRVVRVRLGGLGPSAVVDVPVSALVLSAANGRSPLRKNLVRAIISLNAWKEPWNGAPWLVHDPLRSELGLAPVSLVGNPKYSGETRSRADAYARYVKRSVDSHVQAIDAKRKKLLDAAAAASAGAGDEDKSRVFTIIPDPELPPRDADLPQGAPTLAAIGSDDLFAAWAFAVRFGQEMTLDPISFGGLQAAFHALDPQSGSLPSVIIHYYIAFVGIGLVSKSDREAIASLVRDVAPDVYAILRPEIPASVAPKKPPPFPINMLSWQYALAFFVSSALASGDLPSVEPFLSLTEADDALMGKITALSMGDVAAIWLAASNVALQTDQFRDIIEENRKALYETKMGAKRALRKIKEEAAAALERLGEEYDISPPPKLDMDDILAILDGSAIQAVLDAVPEMPELVLPQGPGELSEVDSSSRQRTLEHKAAVREHEALCTSLVRDAEMTHGRYKKELADLLDDLSDNVTSQVCQALEDVQGHSMRGDWVGHDRDGRAYFVLPHHPELVVSVGGVHGKNASKPSFVSYNGIDDIRAVISLLSAVGQCERIVRKHLVRYQPAIEVGLRSAAEAGLEDYVQEMEEYENVSWADMEADRQDALDRLVMGGGRSSRRAAAASRSSSRRSSAPRYVFDSDEDEDENENEGGAGNGKEDIVHDDTCADCGAGGTLLLCDSCPRAYHPDCVGLRRVPRGSWLCDACSSRTSSRRSGKSRADRARARAQSRRSMVISSDDEDDDDEDDDDEDISYSF